MTKGLGDLFAVHAGRIFGKERLNPLADFFVFFGIPNELRKLRGALPLHLGVMVDDYEGVLARATDWGAKALPAGPNWLELPGGLNIEILRASPGAVEAALAVNPRA